MSNDGRQPSGFGEEATIDVQYMTAIGRGIAMQVWYTAADNDDVITAQHFLSFLLELVNSTDRAWLYAMAVRRLRVQLGRRLLLAV